LWVISQGQKTNKFAGDFTGRENQVCWWFHWAGKPSLLVISFFTLSSFYKLVTKMKSELFSSPELKAQVSFSDHLLSVICLTSNVCLLDFYIFNFFSRTAGPILTKVGTNHP
jgi:hypothetical protein